MRALRPWAARGAWAGESAAAAGGEGSAAGESDVALRHVEVPFGPFLAAGALSYVFLESWWEVSFSILWGRL